MRLGVSYRERTERRLDRIGAGTERDTILANPASLIGSAVRITRWAHHQAWHGWAAVLAWTGIILLLIITWAAVLVIYATLTAFPVLWIGWAFWTLNRRHHVWDIRRAALAAAELTGDVL